MRTIFCKYLEIYIYLVYVIYLFHTVVIIFDSTYIWRPFPTSLHEVLIKLLEKFEIMYPLPTVLYRSNLRTDVTEVIYSLFTILLICLSICKIEILTNE